MTTADTTAFGGEPTNADIAHGFCAWWNRDVGVLDSYLAVEDADKMVDNLTAEHAKSASRWLYRQAADSIGYGWVGPYDTEWSDDDVRTVARALAALARDGRGG